MPSRPTITVPIGPDDWRFLESLAGALDLSPTDAVAAFWKIGASAYAAQRLGYELPKSLLDYGPDQLLPIWQEWLKRQSKRSMP